MEIHSGESVSLAAARALRGGVLPHVPPPAAPVCTWLHLELQADADSEPEIVLVDPGREESWRVAMQPGEGARQWTAEILTPSQPTLLYYHFRFKDGSQLRERRQTEGREKGMLREPLLDQREQQLGMGRSRERSLETLVVEAVYGEWKEQDFRIAVYQPEERPPAWVPGQVFYQIVPDRFARAGETPRRDRTYQYEARHLAWGDRPERPPKGRDFYGGNLRGVIERLDYLVDLGVTVIYFTPIFLSPTNHRYDAIDYLQIDPQLGAINDLIELIQRAGARGIRVLLDGVFNHCSSESVYFQAAQSDRRSPYYRWFHFTNWPDQYLGWLGVPTMPEFGECPEVEAFFFGEQGIAQHWLQYGISGWRTDVTPWLSNEFWRRFRRAVRRDYPNAFLISEDWADATQRLLGDTFDSTMNYRFGYSLLGWAGGKLNALEFDDRLATLRRDTPLQYQHALLNLIDSHDTARAFTLLGGNRARYKLAVLFQFAYPGLPMLYSGDETAQEGEFAEDSRRSFPWDRIDEDMHRFYRTVIHVRRQSRALSLGEVETVWISDDGFGYAIARKDEQAIVIAVFNTGSLPLHVEIPVSQYPAGDWRDLLDEQPDANVTEGRLVVDLAPLQGCYYSLQAAE